MRILIRLALMLMGLCAFLCMLASIAYTQVTSSSQMLSGFNQFADTSLKDVSASAYPDYAKAITGYLTGAREDLIVTAEDGTERPGFTEKETAHMQDVRALVQGLKWFRFISGGIALLVLGLFWLKSRGSASREEMLKSMLGGLAKGACLLLGIILALAVWGLVGFDSLFIQFHRLFFSNSLWLLNPREHLLIMLMPTPFFIWYAKQIMLSCWPILAAMAAVIVAGFRFGRK